MGTCEVQCKDIAEHGEEFVMSVEFKDNTSKLPSTQDVDDAISAIQGCLGKITSLPSELGVNIPNILRCLKVTKIIIERNQDES